MTAPTFARAQVERSATCRVMVMKYWSQLNRSLMINLVEGLTLFYFDYDFIAEFSPGSLARITPI